MDLEECVQITDSSLNYLGSYCHKLTALVSVFYSSVANFSMKKCNLTNNVSVLILFENGNQYSFKLNASASVKYSNFILFCCVFSFIQCRKVVSWRVI